MKSTLEKPYYEERKGGFLDMQGSRGVEMTFPLHLHGAVELFLVETGTVRVKVEEEEALLHPGELAVIFPNTPHAYLESTPDSRYTMVICSPVLAGPFSGRLSRMRPVCPFVSGNRLHPDVAYAMNRLAEECLSVPDENAFGALVQLVLARVLPELTLMPGDEPVSADLTGRLVRYLSEHFQQPLTLESVAREMGVSKYHLSHVFSRKLHAGFCEYLSYLRLDRARELLRTTDRSVLDIALDCGFSSQRTFHRAFSRHFGTTPRAFRAVSAGNDRNV